MSVKQPVPEMTPLDENLDERAIAVVLSDGYHVYSWSPGRAGEGVPSTQVHLALPFKVAGVEASVTLRMKSARALDELVAVLLQHRKDVWGDPRT